MQNREEQERLKDLNMNVRYPRKPVKQRPNTKHLFGKVSLLNNQTIIIVATMKDKGKFNISYRKQNRRFNKPNNEDSQSGRKLKRKGFANLKK